MTKDEIIIHTYIDSTLESTLVVLEPSTALRRFLQRSLDITNYEIADSIQSSFYFGFREMSEIEITLIHEQNQEYWDYPIEEEHFFWPLLFVGVGCVFMIIFSFVLNKAKGYDKPEVVIMIGASTALLNWISDFQLMLILSFKKDTLMIPSILFCILPILANIIRMIKWYRRYIERGTLMGTWIKRNAKKLKFIIFISSIGVNVAKMMWSFAFPHEIFMLPISIREQAKLLRYSLLLGLLLQDLPGLYIQGSILSRDTTGSDLELAVRLSLYTTASSLIWGIVQTLMMMKPYDIVYVQIQTQVFGARDQLQFNRKKVQKFFENTFPAVKFEVFVYGRQKQSVCFDFLCYGTETPISDIQVAIKTLMMTEYKAQYVKIHHSRGVAKVLQSILRTRAMVGKGSGGMRLDKNQMTITFLDLSSHHVDQIVSSFENLDPGPFYDWKTIQAVYTNLLSQSIFHNALNTTEMIQGSRDAVEDTIDPSFLDVGSDTMIAGEIEMNSLMKAHIDTRLSESRQVAKRDPMTPSLPLEHYSFENFSSSHNVQKLALSPVLSTNPSNAAKTPDTPSMDDIGSDTIQAGELEMSSLMKAHGSSC